MKRRAQNLYNYDSHRYLPARDTQSPVSQGPAPGQINRQTRS